MAEGYCWVCDRRVDDDPCPTCGTSQYRRPDRRDGEPNRDEVLDTTPVLRPAGARNPVLIAIVVVVAIVVMVLVFQAGAGIS